MAIQIIPREGGRQISTVITAAEQVLDTGPLNVKEGSLVGYGQIVVAANTTFSLRINGSTASIDQSFILSGAAAPTSGLLATAVMMVALNGADFSFKLEIPRLATGRKRTILVTMLKTDAAGVTNGIAIIAYTWNNTVDPISTWGISSSLSGGIGVGSEIAGGPR